MAINWNGPQPAPVALWQLIHANFPIARNLGIYENRNIAGTDTKSHHAEGRALDIGLLVTMAPEKVLGDRLFQIFIDSMIGLGMDEVIWNRQIYSSAKPTIHTYTGQNPHTNHVHVGYTRDGSQATGFPPDFLVSIAELRTGLEDLRSAPVSGLAVV